MKKQIITILIMLISALFLIAGISLKSQELKLPRKDLIIEFMSRSNEPVKIISFEIGDSAFKSGEKFSGADEWLKELKIKTENTSGKTATHISFGILFPRPDEQKDIPPAYYKIRRGDKYNALKGNDSGYKVKSDVDKNQTSLSLSQDELEGVFSFLSRNNYPSRIKKIKIQVEEVIFDDGTMWSIGTWYKVDPNDLKKLIPIDDEGGATKSAAFSFSDPECTRPLIVKEDCIRTENFVCSFTKAIPFFETRGTDRVIDSVEPCYIENANGQQTSQTCGVNKITTSAVPCSTPTPTPTPDDPCSWEREYACYNKGDSWIWDPFRCDCLPRQGEIGGGCDANPGNCSNSPIVIDISGNGFDLTNATNGVLFDLDSNGNKEWLAWTSVNSDDAWLAFDRNNNGLIDNGRELFGNFTSQPPSATANGFIALEVYDRTIKGGNGDGQIDNRDDVFARLKLWRDINHDGVSQANELNSLPELGVSILELDYKESKRTDEHGNRFRYRAKVKDAQGEQIGRWAWDVFLIVKKIS